MKFFMKLVATLFLTFVAIIPALFIAGAYGLFDPHGFLQGFFVIGLGVWFLGSAQLVLMAVWSILMLVMWKN